MSLITTEMSQAKKTFNCSVTYRAGTGGNQFQTCPASCSLNPEPKRSSNRVDKKYLTALLKAKPRKGYSFTYSHFDFKYYLDQMGPNTTTINQSTESPRRAANLVRKNIPVCVTVPVNFWEGTNQKTTKISKDVRVVRCPAESNEKIGCSNCGGYSAPLCARQDRNYAIAFTAHGSQKKKVGSNVPGGCYGTGGNVALHWRNLARSKSSPATDADTLLKFIKTISPRAIIRHHVVGDIGK